MLTGLGVDEYFTRTDSTGTSNFLSDALGSTIALADSTGAVQTQYTYDPFGTTTVQGAANASSYEFTGRENDGDGLYYYRARYYSPMLSRFISQDPIQFAGGINYYAYAGGDPIIYIDPPWALLDISAVDRRHLAQHRRQHEDDQGRSWLRRSWGGAK